jgi:dihydrofolate synthase/folylpolyglutamate synthase
VSQLSRLFALEQFGIKLGLDNIRTLVAALGHPERAWQAVHIAGTNGKGSVTAMVDTALRHARHRTGRYTSPHLDRLEERFEIDGVPVASTDLEHVASDVFAVVDRLHAASTLPVLPTFFEVSTAMAFELFRRAGVDVGVIEVGLGGRFDATNVLSPIVTAITNIDFDHERHLGRTLSQIGMEKAGIAKPGVPMIVGSVSAEAHASIADACRAQGAPLIDAGDGVDVDAAMQEGVANVRVTTPWHAYPRVRLALRGRHQVANALVAVRVLEHCEKAGIRVMADDIVAGISEARWPARLEWLDVPVSGEEIGAPPKGTPSTRSRRLLIDAAHNPAGARALAEYLRDAGVAPLPMVLGVMQDKDLDGMLDALIPVASSIVTTEAATPRALSASALAAAIATRAPHVRVRIEPNPERAVLLALSERVSGEALSEHIGTEGALSERISGEAADARVEGVVAGSIYLIGPLRARLIERGARPK